MGDNLFIAGLILCIFLLGVACFVWTNFMSAFMGGFLLRVLPKDIRRPLTRIIGAGTILFSLLLFYGTLKDVF
ncbi:MAG TPA: hypothetical protein VGO68_16915 [Pyrinomonadaceae bacterium]|jgi:hypothetical protein|nr:hypothetical protein [Pyrinomonadaceae bacterium]